ncbi:MAG: transglycosylase domain-containing protein [Acidobacteria bacterium]|nr:transglycosylase domain-containing protein [Acidobacteriota bacterium]
MRRLVGEFVGSASGIANGIRIAALHVRGRGRARIALRILGISLFVAVLALELHTSWIQSKILSALARRLTFVVKPGAGPDIRYPASGPYDRRAGYSALPFFLDRLSARNYRVEARAQSSNWSLAVSRAVGFHVYGEKGSTGLRLLDREGRTLFGRRYPERTYSSFDGIPRVIVGSLLYIENRELLDAGTPRRNPAVEWDRLAGAMADLAVHWLRPAQPLAGGSTLATQLEKVRHSPGGRTGSVAEKARQMAAASLRAYLGGEDTTAARGNIVRDYLNSLPLASRSGYGEVTGLGDGLWAWYGAEFDTVNRLLAALDAQPAGARVLPEQAAAYRLALSLLLATRKPSAYLNGDRGILTARVDAYLRLLAGAGIISGALRDAALRAGTAFTPETAASPANGFVERKATDAVRVELMNLLDAGRLYDLDRLDLKVGTTLDGAVSERVTAALRNFSDSAYAADAGLTGERLLTGGLESVVYSFTLYERTPAGNALRVQVDTVDQPFNLNQGSKLELGSTAKLRTLVTYLEVVSELHRRFTAEGAVPARDEPADPLTLWAAGYLASASDKGLAAMLEAAMNRTYSAAPGETFFTGGGAHRFANFDSRDDGRRLTVRDAFQRSVNLVFIRLLRDLVAYHMFRTPGVTPRILTDRADPMRAVYLRRFADEEGKTFLYRFYSRYAGKRQNALELLAQRVGPRVHRLAVIHRSVWPGAGFDEFAAFLARADRPVPETAMRKLYGEYAPGRFNLNDRGYLANVHPLELWLVEYLERHPAATFAEVATASAGERQECYRWLFQNRRGHGQDLRIRSLLEADAFREIHRRWQRLGYPFPSLVPSLATAIGSSGDTPAALAELMGIVLNDGVRRPSARIREMRFAEATPYETVLVPRPSEGIAVLSPAIAEKVRQELIGVVEGGTARRARAAVVLADGRSLPVGGKTGTGDNRLHVYGSRGGLIGSRAVNRTAAFVFFIGDRFFGTVIAYVPGKQGGEYSFTSALPVQVFRHIAPGLGPLLAREGVTPGKSRPEAARSAAR